MPAYGTAVGVPALYPGDSYLVWNAESPATNSASQQVALAISPTGDPVCASVEIKFSADPGTFSITIQTADTDVAGAYIALGSAAAITSVNSAFYASYQLTDLRCNSMRLFMTDDPSNAVTTTAKITR